MLDAETRRRIDTARDILVGKVPDPKSQVEQITIALIYKFMDDMDAESEELGGKRKFFAGDFARYGWAKLMYPGLGGHETLNLYAEAITRMPENPGVPLLFRNIFKNAYLPYRDPETLKLFLKTIDEFNYDHSERLGDAFEYLLSVLGSQGDAGQFRTPRHIIDFIVEVVNPQKHETILDPACGTAGFLISSYKHIQRANTDEHGHITLTPDERGRLGRNLWGYDISPDMVRLSLVNLYLHGFADPRIYEYDTLTSEERWNEVADVILANPPFMSPKGGIKPHKRFSVKSKRSEVLFVDYMAEHLTPAGRAGIIVPEGVIFQSQNAYKQLRKMLVENALVAVVSLPAGVFQPYSGVKTSILILDKSHARQRDAIAFFKVENDGFGLGAQRRPIEQNDLPQMAALLREWIEHGRVSDLEQKSNVVVVPKAKIAESGEYNLSGERYREVGTRKTAYDWRELGEIILSKPQYGSGASKVPFDGKVRYVRITDLTDQGELKSDDPVSPSIIEQDCFLEAGDLLIARSGSVGRTYLHRNQQGIYQYAGYLIRFRIDPIKALPEFVFYITQSNPWREWILSNSKTGTLTNINAQQYASFGFPLPPLEVQREIVAEIEGYQRVIDGARAVLDAYRPHILVDPAWPLVEVGEIVDFVSGLTVSIPEVESENGTPIIAINNVTEDGDLTLEGLRGITPPKKTLNYVQKGDLLFNWRNGSKHLVGKTALFDLDGEFLFASFLLGVRARADQVNNRYLWYTLNIYRREGRYMQLMRQNVNGLFNREELKITKIPLPPLEVQRAIVTEIEAEQRLVAANRELITRFEQKIQAALARVWGTAE